MSYLKDKTDVEHIRETSDRALDLMSQHNVIPSPSNYQVWYEYASEGNMSLNKTIDEMIKKNSSFTSKLSNNLFERFFSTDQEQNAVTHAGQGIQTELAKISKAVRVINNGTVKYNTVLSDSLRGLDDIQGGSEMKNIISDLMENTKEMALGNNSAQKKLQESAKTVQKLQAALEAVRQESLTDMLTNIGNRKSFEENLKKAIQDASKNNGDLCLVIGDIDFFKKFNDTWGHHVGDQVLKAVAHSIKTRVGDVGTTARYGGEEFVILLPGTTMEDAMELSEMVRLSISQRSMKRKSTGERIGKITCSFGVAKYRINEHRNEFLERADAALYRSKSNGRNQVTAEDDGSPNVVKIA